ncbi:class I SAM-dependent methyltransferase [Actomonas aquatica]|uniref:Demethylmenaquinone methyltransferase n=1 Tax=Actomonas aquatica TaxID=2866162 RepID=A0ABZ1CB83_9BACT|nr:class I SAM-dependent methyltransferase [Opitutus sp. WL0086]WRQ88949.1 class I SAM-dependent methyltransferase [Opitutus sp. WL0086]
MPDPNAVNSMFGRIAGRYDVANRLLSGGVDIWWRKRLIRAVAAHQPADVLDLATGSGDVAFALADGLADGTPITGMDFCRPMLDEAEIKQRDRGGYEQITFREGDGLNLPVEDASYDAATISFGLRNMADRHRCLSELHRILRPGGRLWVLEFSQPYRWFRPIYYAYLKYLLPIIAGIVTGDKGAYDYLCGSIETYPGHEGIAAEMERAGFDAVECHRLTLGIVALHGGWKKPSA